MMRTKTPSASSRTSRGFTIIELLVVVAIMILLSGFAITYSNISEEQINLYTETAKVVQAILTSRSLAVTSYLVPGERVCGHGFRLKDANTFEVVRYIRLADPSSACVEISNDSQNVSNSYNVVATSTYDFVNGVTFDESIDPSSIPYFILFRPPDPDIFFYHKDGLIFDSNVTETALILKGQHGGKMRIVVGQGGQINYEPMN